MSRWLVGSSSSSRFGRWRTISASVRRAFSPPEKRATGGRRHVAAKVEAAEEVAQLLLARVGFEPRQMPERRFVDAQLLDLVLREVADARAAARRGACPRAAAAFRRAPSAASTCRRRSGRAARCGRRRARPSRCRASTGGATRVAERRVLEPHELPRGRRRPAETRTRTGCRRAPRRSAPSARAP